MPRRARIKSVDAVYHIMVRSISDVSLFRKYEDKDRYLEILRKYKSIFGFKVYAYCLMDTHAHLIIDTNGADISKVMHSINQVYAQYFNKKYNRHGHVLQDRFKSIIINDDRYLLTVSSYIHNNPSSIKKYANCVDKYKYSSLGIYLGNKSNISSIIDTGFILSQFSKDIIKSRLQYREFIKLCSDPSVNTDTEFKNELTEYRSERRILVRNYNYHNIIAFVAQKTELKEACVNMKHIHKSTEMRALCAFLMRCLCNYKCKDMCRIFGNITQARVSKLCSIGADAVCEKDEYTNIVNEFIERQAKAV